MCWVIATNNRTKRIADEAMLDLYVYIIYVVLCMYVWVIATNNDTKRIADEALARR